MSAYIKLLTLEYPRYQGDIRLDHPEIGEEFVCPSTYASVQSISSPEFNIETQTSYQLPPVNIDGGWSMVWAVRDLTAEELESRRIAQQQNSTQNTNVSGSEPNVIG
jgi:hypothetical protein